MILAFVERKQEYYRFTDKVIQADLIIPYDFKGVVTLIRNFQVLHSIDSFVFVGLRHVDIKTISILKESGRNIIILQHALNENRSDYTLKIIFSNTGKIVKWLTFHFLFRLLWRKSILNRHHKTNVFLYSCTEYYLRRFSQLKIRFHKRISPMPNPFIYGTITPIEIVERNTSIFYIDEPLENTLGLSIKDQIKALRHFSTTMNVEFIEVKMHPRSPQNKFKGLSFIRIVENIPNKIDTLLGYKSNLLKGSFNFKRFFRYNPEKQVFIEEKLTKQYGEYVEYVKQDLNEIGII